MDELLGVGAAASSSSSNNGLEACRYHSEAPVCGAGRCVEQVSGLSTDPTPQPPAFP